MIIAIAIITILYSLLILAFCYHWRDEDNVAPSVSSDDAPLVSVIVAFRNEEKNLPALVESLLAQSYGKLEIILVDDHSEDASMSVAQSYADQRIKVVCSHDNISGKKAALKLGYEKSSGEILFFTDADCILERKCIELSVAKMLNDKCSMICGPVCYIDRKGFLQKTMQLEFLSLTGSGAAGFFMGHPFMCNGANFAVMRDVYAAADTNEKYSSGDDVFLLHYVHKNHKVGFAQYHECIVKTMPPKSIGEFFSQRVRWASKASGYRNPFAIFVSGLILLMSLSLIVAFVAACVCHIYLLVFFCLFFMKLVVDSWFIMPVLRFYNRRKLCLAIIPLTLLYPIYIVVTAVASIVFRPKWKGRKIR